jgi:hypothetical protein
VQAKATRKDNLSHENKLYDQIHDEHGKLLDQREKQKADVMREKMLEDKHSRDQQLREEQSRKKKE